MATVGGRRPGAGRKPGALTKRTREIATAEAKSGITPLGYMMQVLRDENSSGEDKRWAAHAAAPYMHPRLQAMTLSGDPQNPLVTKIEVSFVGPQ